VVELLREGEIDPHTAKAMMDGLKWSAERMAPKAHMPQSLINHESPQGTMTPQQIILRAAKTDADSNG